MTEVILKFRQARTAGECGPRRYLTKPMFKREGKTLIPLNDDANLLLSRISDGDACILTIRAWSGSGKVIGFGPKVCRQCGVSFNPHPGSEATECSLVCAGLQRRRPPIDRFMEKFIPEPNSGCWIWLGSLGGNGYGTFGHGGKRANSGRAHMFSYRHFVGPIPKGLVLRHTCDNAICVNPDHLVPGTQAENIEDAFVRGRRSRGKRRMAR